jgi:hypothetical protein
LLVVLEHENMRKITMVAAGLAFGLSLATAHAADKVTIQLKWVAQAHGLRVGD